MKQRAKAVSAHVGEGDQADDGLDIAALLNVEALAKSSINLWVWPPTPARLSAGDGVGEGRLRARVAGPSRRGDIGESLLASALLSGSRFVDVRAPVAAVDAADGKHDLFTQRRVHATVDVDGAQAPG